MPKAPRAKPVKAGLEATIIAHDPQMVEIVRLLERLATASSNVVLSGESGTGKDLAAHALHLWGERSALPMVTVDLPSIPGSLLESELFGYERGAFTGAAQRKAGKFELAGKGTLFLDQIGELSPLHQAKLLRAVEERRFERLGGTEPVELEARLIASASADLEEAVTRELFRRDLFHRLGVFWIRLPPLRERPADIVPLAEHFLEKEVERRGRAPRRFSPDALELFATYAWPGNVRELKGVVEHGAILSKSETFERADIPAYVLESPSVTWGVTLHKRPTLAAVEKSYIERVLRDVGGNTTRAAEILGISRKSLWQRRKRYEVD
ncbi:MAG: sigma-54-dependent Fis family transcriptional regulator [Acidobacteria bacterium]|nr:MAG: sigma-54-dependent Fis family transcriptional regulator [Acidobacteriota bacterium]